MAGDGFEPGLLDEVVEVVEADPDVFDQEVVVIAVADCFSAARRRLELQRELRQLVRVSVPGIGDHDDFVVEVGHG